MSRYEADSKSEIKFSVELNRLTLVIYSGIKMNE